MLGARRSCRGQWDEFTGRSATERERALRNYVTISGLLRSVIATLLDDPKL